MFKALNKRRKRKGQSTLEFTVLIIIVIAALLSIQTYVKRAAQASLKSAADDISGEQYSPGNTNYTRVTTRSSTTKQSSHGGVHSTNLIGNDVTNVTTNMIIGNTELEYWG